MFVVLNKRISFDCRTCSCSQSCGGLCLREHSGNSEILKSLKMNTHKLNMNYCGV